MIKTVRLQLRPADDPGDLKIEEMPDYKIGFRQSSSIILHYPAR
jgi:hypothetical protein